MIGIVATGCGLSEYEAGLKEEQRLLSVAQQEDDLLGPPVVIEVPTQGSGSQTSLQPDTQFFFRPPKGIDSKRDEKHKFLQDSQRKDTNIVCYYFPRDPKVEKKDCPFSAVIVVSNKWEQQVQAGKGSGSKVTTYSLPKLLDCYRMNEKDSGAELAIAPPRRPPIVYTPWPNEDNRPQLGPHIYKCQRGEIVQGDQLVPVDFVVIFLIEDSEKGATDEQRSAYHAQATRLMKVSLETLGVGAPDAVNLYKSYTKMHQPKKASTSGAVPPGSDSDKGRIIGGSTP